MVKGVSIADMDNEFITKSFWYRKHNYVITEISMKAYDKTVKQATHEVEVDGVTIERPDPQEHNRILMAATVTVDGEKADVDEIYSRGTRLVRQLQRDIQDVLFKDEPEEEPDDTGEATAQAK